MNSMASIAVLIPPIPTTGMLTEREASHTILTASGFRAGPDSPPVVVASLGCAVPKRNSKGYYKACTDGPVFDSKEVVI